MKLLRFLLGYGGMLASAAAAPEADTVVLLHGLGRTRFSMARLACELDRQGYRVINATYPSRSQSLESLATEWLPTTLRGTATAPRVHFVTHSMGGIVLRLWLRECGAPPNLGRVVMLAPPNAGSEITDRMAAHTSFRWATGVNGRRLGTDADALPRTLGAWPKPAPGSESALGIIAGDRSLNPLLSAGLPAPNDGKVSVASSHLTGEHDPLVLPYSHTWLGWRTGTIRQVSAFLRRGEFLR